MTTLPLSPQIFAILSALVEERCGLHYALEDCELFAEPHDFDTTFTAFGNTTLRRGSTR